MSIKVYPTFEIGGKTHIANLPAYMNEHDTALCGQDFLGIPILVPNTIDRIDCFDCVVASMAAGDTSMLHPNCHSFYGPDVPVDPMGIDIPRGRVSLLCQ